MYNSGPVDIQKRKAYIDREFCFDGEKQKLIKVDKRY